MATLIDDLKERGLLDDVMIVTLAEFGRTPGINASLGRDHFASAWSSISNRRVNRFLHITESVADVVGQNKMQRALGQQTGTCFQRCVGMDALNSLFSVTFDIDEREGTAYHRRFREFIVRMQEMNYVIGGAMTDPKGDRSKGPSQQSDPDMFVRVVERRADVLIERFPETASDLALRSGRPRQLPLHTVREQADRRARLGQPVREWRLAIWERIGQPVSIVPAALAGFAVILWRARRRRRLPLAGAVALGIGLSLALWAVSIVAHATSLSGGIPPSAAGALPTVVASCVAAFCLWRS